MAQQHDDENWVLDDMPSLSPSQRDKFSDDEDSQSEARDGKNNNKIMNAAKNWVGAGDAADRADK